MSDSGKTSNASKDGKGTTPTPDQGGEGKCGFDSDFETCKGKGWIILTTVSTCLVF